MNENKRMNDETWSMKYEVWENEIDTIFPLRLTYYLQPMPPTPPLPPKKHVFQSPVQSKISLPKSPQIRSISFSF